MSRFSAGRLLLVVMLAVLLAPATARADGVIPEVLPDVSDVLVGSLAQVGMVSLAYLTPLGSQVDFHERVGGRLKPLGTVTARLLSPQSALLQEAARWRCDRLVRRFEATAITPSGSRSQDSFDVRTPSCANRLKLSAPRRVALGAKARVSVQDRWKNGAMKPRLCITPPRGRTACRVVALRQAVDIAGRRFRATKRGLWRVELRFHGHRVRTAVAVGGARYVAAATLPTVLATGDSLMQGVDGFLGDRLAKTASVRSDLQAGTGISRGLEWLTRAGAQAKRYRPRTTVVFMADGAFTMRTPDGAMRECCGDLWAEEYRRRARAMMKTYIRRGRARVLWLTVPTPRHPKLAAVTGVVNGALLRAAEGLTGARIVRLDLLFSPNGYRDYMPYRGKTVKVRHSDGVHLTATGAAIAADAIERAMR